MMKLSLLNNSWLLITLLTLLFATINPMPANASLYWNHSVRNNPISVCFVGDAVTSRADRVQQVLDYIKEFEYAANIDFKYLGTCPDSKPQADGNDYFDGDIRVALPATQYNGDPNFALGQIPGKGCPMFLDEKGNYNKQNDGWGSWSNAPDELLKNRGCLYNLKLGDDPWNSTPYLNHTLHEFGHALGLSHEHERSDVDSSLCKEPGFGGSANNGFLTPYDKKSVMNYSWNACPEVIGNYANTGLSDWDKLGLHILYPEDRKQAEFLGTTVVRSTDTLKLESAWKNRGANMSFVAGNFVWKLADSVISTTPEMSIQQPPGIYKLEVTHSDFLGRNYSYTGIVRVLEPTTYNQQIVAPVAAQLPLF